MVVDRFIVWPSYAINLPDNRKGKCFHWFSLDTNIGEFSFAYIEFSDKDSVQTALALDESLFKGRQIKVNWIFKVGFSMKTLLGDWKTNKSTRFFINRSNTTWRISWFWTWSISTWWCLYAIYLRTVSRSCCSTLFSVGISYGKNKWHLLILLVVVVDQVISSHLIRMIDFNWTGFVLSAHLEWNRFSLDDLISAPISFEKVIQ